MIADTAARDGDAAALRGLYETAVANRNYYAAERKKEAVRADALAAQLAEAEKRNAVLVEALADIGAAIVEQADDTLWVGLGETCVDRIGTMLDIGENSDLDELLLARRAAKALTPGANGEKKT